MDDIIKQCINDYKADRITWHDIQDIVEGRLLMIAGGMKEYSKIPLRQRIEEENKILEEIERGIQ